MSHIHLSKQLRRRSLLTFLLATTIALATGCSQQASKLEPGQIWSYDNRSGENASTIMILHIERDTPLGAIYFVSVRALDVKRLGRRIRTTEVWPLVFTEEALKGTLRSFQWGEKVDRPYLKQLDAWWRDAREGRAAERTFNVPIKDALEQLRQDQPGADKRSFAEV